MNQTYISINNKGKNSQILKKTFLLYVFSYLAT